MDFGVPPPFTGTLEEPLDDDIQFAVDEDDSDMPDHALTVPDDISQSITEKKVMLLKENDATGSSCTLDHIIANGRYSKNSLSTSEQLPSNCTSEVNGILPKLGDSLESCPSFVCRESISAKESSSTILCDDCFGDFADFVTASAPTDGIQVEEHISSSPECVASISRSPPLTILDNDDEWGDFDQAPRVPEQNSPAECEHKASENDWCAFDSVNSTNNGENDEWSADFGDFNGTYDTGPSSMDAQKDSDPIVYLPSLDILCNESDLWGIDSEEEMIETNVFNIIEMLDCKNLEEEMRHMNNTLMRSAELWLALRIIEDARALKYEWKTSRLNENMLTELRVDPKAVGRGSLPPLSTDNVLKPIPVSSNETKYRDVKTTIGEGLTTTTSISATVFKGTSRDSHLIPSPLPSPPSNPIVPAPSINSLSVPPADFDWDNSGLTNPTKGANRSSALLDIDFLSANGYGSTGSTISTLQRELDELGLSSFPVKSVAKPTSQPSVLDTIMSSAAQQQKKYRSPSELSLDARALHDQLPDIDYLRANMIMFPLGRSGPNS